MSFIKEFKAFAMKGNVIDMAVGVIMGGAFGKIVSSLVSDVLMPLIGILTGGIDMNSLSFSVGEAVIKYGSFMQNVLDFLIISFSIFIMIKAIGRIMHRKKTEEAVSAPPTPSKEEVLLAELRDLLKERQDKNI